MEATLREVYGLLSAHYGPQAAWWPLFTNQPRLEIALGALLVQQTRWERVELAMLALRDGLGPRFSPEGIATSDPADLMPLIRPVAYYNAKARWLPGLCTFFARHPESISGALSDPDLPRLRSSLLALPGVGPETADTILLYAGGRASFVVDASLRRLFDRLGVLPLDPLRASYDELRQLFMTSVQAGDYSPYGFGVGEEARLYAEYHALIVEHGVRHCTARTPRCATSGAPRVYTAEAGRVWHCPPCAGCPVRESCGFWGKDRVE